MLVHQGTELLRVLFRKIILLNLEIALNIALSNPQWQGDPVVARTHLVFDIVPQISHVCGRVVSALRRHLMRNRKASIICSDVAVTPRAIISVEVALLYLARMEAGRLKLPHAPMTMLALVQVKRNAAILITVLRQRIGARSTQSIHGKAHSSDLMPVKLLCLAPVQLIGCEALVGTAL